MLRRVVSETEIEIAFGVVRLRLNRLLESIDGILSLALREVGSAEIVIGQRVIWFEAQRLFVGFDRFGILARVVKRIALVVEGFGLLFIRRFFRLCLWRWGRARLRRSRWLVARDLGWLGRLARDATLREQGAGPAGNIAHARRSFESDVSTTDDVLPQEGAGATGDVLRQAEERRAGERERQE